MTIDAIESPRKLMDVVANDTPEIKDAIHSYWQLNRIHHDYRGLFTDEVVNDAKQQLMDYVKTAREV